VKAHRNVTLSLPESLLRQLRVYAAERNQSMTGVMTEAVRKLMDEGTGAQNANRRFLERIRNAPDWGTKGRISWKRDELHDQ
jgi:hypothetical protein